MSEFIVEVPLVKAGRQEDSMTLSQCSNRSIPSECFLNYKDHRAMKNQCLNRKSVEHTFRSNLADEETLPIITPRVTQSRAASQAKIRPTFRYTIRREATQPVLKCDTETDKLVENENETNDCDYDDEVKTELLAEKIKLSDDNEEKIVFLPRLNDSDQRRNCVNKRSIESECVRFPDISAISKRNGLLALNRSITDLLDPEMEILNRIKHLPRKKRKKKRKKFDCGTPV